MRLNFLKPQISQVFFWQLKVKINSVGFFAWLLEEPTFQKWQWLMMCYESSRTHHRQNANVSKRNVQNLLIKKKRECQDCRCKSQLSALRNIFCRKQGTEHLTWKFQKVYSSALIEKDQIFGRPSEFWVMVIHVHSALLMETLGQRTNTSDWTPSLFAWLAPVWPFHVLWTKSPLERVSYWITGKHS
jgi:hypothetical protein